MAALKAHHLHHHHGGFLMFVVMSLDSLGIAPDQDAAIRKAEADLHAKMQPAHDAEKAVLVTLAAGVVAGNVDEHAIDAAIAQVSSAAAALPDAAAATLDEIHAALTPAQRAALVGKVEANMQVWREANAEDETASSDARGGQLGELAKELELSPDQVESIRAAFKAAMANAPAHFDAQEAEAHLKAFATAFEADTFDAKKLTTGSAVNAHVATFGLTRMARFYGAATPALTADQRVKLADLLQRHANYKRTRSET